MSDDFDFSHLLDSTRHVGVEDAAVRSDPDDLDAPESSADPPGNASVHAGTPGPTSAEAETFAGFCERCGTPRQAIDRFCGGCGNTLAPVGAPAPVEPPNPIVTPTAVSAPERVGTPVPVSDPAAVDTPTPTPIPIPPQVGSAAEVTLDHVETPTPPPPVPTPPEPSSNPFVGSGTPPTPRDAPGLISFVPGISDLPPDVAGDAGAGAGTADSTLHAGSAASAESTGNGTGSGPAAPAPITSVPPLGSITPTPAPGTATATASDVGRASGGGPVIADRAPSGVQPDPPAPVGVPPIEELPGGAGSHAPDDVEPDGDGDEDGATVSIAAYRAARAASTVPLGPTVEAVHCPAGHANPPHNDQCRHCRVTIEDRTITTIPRPSLGVLRFEDGHDEALDQPLVIGRKPIADETTGSEPGRAVRLDDPDKLLSRIHAEVQLAGWQVQVIDRESMNHTFVQIPGQVLFQLRPGEPFPIPPGTRIVFAEVTECRYVLNPEP